MSAVEVAARPVDRRSDDDDLNHIVCCDDNRSLCGADMTEAPWSEADTDCVVCLDLEHTPCAVVCR